MKILHIIKKGTPPGYVDTIIKDHSNAGNEVTVVNITQDKDYTKLMDLIETSDKVFSW